MAHYCRGGSKTGHCNWICELHDGNLGKGLATAIGCDFWVLRLWTCLLKDLECGDVGKDQFKGLRVVSFHILEDIGGGNAVDWDISFEVLGSTSLPREAQEDN